MTFRFLAIRQSLSRVTVGDSFALFLRRQGISSEIRWWTRKSSLSAAVDVVTHFARPVACGGFSDIYKLFFRESFYAIKHIKCNEHDRDLVEALRNREAAILAAVRHPNIVRCLRGLKTDSDNYIVTHWAENGTLRTYLEMNTDADRLRLLSEVASAVNHLHTLPHPVIHGDIYIDNVLVSGTESALLSDFGLSTIARADAEQSEEDGDCILGRPAYEAPERHGALARRTLATDVFAFGMLMFHAYSGRSPFSSLGHPGAIVLAIYAGRRPERSEISRDDFPDALWELVQECWAQDPNDRPAMSEVHQRLLDMRGTR